MSREIYDARQVSRRALLQGTAAVGAGLALAGSTSMLRPSAVFAQDLPREETLYVAGWDFQPVVSFNPMRPQQAWPTQSRFQYIYESLFSYDQSNGAMDPALAKDITWTDSTTAVVTLQDGTMWADGTPLTSADVIYTYNLPQRVDALYYSDFGDYVSSVEATDDRTLTFHLNPEQLNPLLFGQQLRNVLILPQHIWEPLESGEELLTDVIDLDPVGSGPYKVIDASTERTAIQKLDSYWGTTILGDPVPTYIVHPIFDSNDTANLAFSQGEIDLSQTFLPEIWKLWEDDGKPAGTWFKEEPFHLPGSIPLLFINVNKAPLDNPDVRRALAYSIDYAHIAQTAMSRYSSPANASLVIPGGGENAYYDADGVAAEGWTYNPDEAKRILEEVVGATKDGDTYKLADGTSLGGLTIHCPDGWTDWQTAIELVAQTASEVGFGITANYPQQAEVTTRNQAGDFDLAIWYVAGAGPASPWQRFRDVLDNRGVPPLGEQAFWNFNRYQSDDIPPLLDAIPVAAAEDLPGLYAQLDAILRRDVPVIPLMYRPDEFYEFFESTWSGFPNSENPVGPPAQKDSGVRLLYNLKPVAE